MENNMSSLALKDRKNLELKKHVNAIHCSNNLTLVQRKLFNALLFNAYPELPHQQQFHIKGKELCRLIGYNSKDTGKLKSALLGLITIAIEWNVIDGANGQEKKWKASSILASAELADGLCVYEYSQVMKDFLYQPEIYGRINIELISKFKSSYGLALYENCVRYQGLAQTPWFSLETFRKLMGVFDDKYIAFKDFKKRVVDIAVSEINTLSAIAVIPEVERVNQKVTKIRFKLDKNITHNNLTIVTEIVDKELNEILSTIFGLSPQMIAEAIVKYEHQYIREKIEIIMHSDNFLSGKIRGLAGYLIEALKKDYKPSRSSNIVIHEQRKIEDEEANEKKRKEDSRAERYKLYVTKKINTYLTNLTKDQHTRLLEEFETFIKNQGGILQEWYRKYGIEYSAIKSSFNNFIKDSKKEQLGELLSMDDFISLIDESN